MPFAWGPNDCVSFAAEWVLRATGKDFMDGRRGYDTEFGALRTIKEAGVENMDLDELVSMHLPRVDLGLAQRGDIALAIQGNSPGLMVIEGDALVGPGFDGLERLPRDHAVKTWRVG